MTYDELVAHLAELWRDHQHDQGMDDVSPETVNP